MPKKSVANQKKKEKKSSTRSPLCRIVMEYIEEEIPIKIKTVVDKVSTCIR
jgi:hypothetical protein